MNLTAITDFDEVVEKHFVDSVSLIQVVVYLLKKESGYLAFTIQQQQFKEEVALDCMQSDSV